MKTIFVKPPEVVREWYVLDAEGKMLGRVAAQVAAMLRGKTKPQFSPMWEIGDYVVIVNADKIGVSGSKRTEKLYHRHSGFMGGLKTVTFTKLIERHPEMPLELAIKGMLPKGPLGRKMLKNVKIYAGNKHPHAAQNPKKLEG